MCYVVCLFIGMVIGKWLYEPKPQVYEGVRYTVSKDGT